MAELKYNYDKTQSKLQRNREVRDLYKKLMRNYRSHKIYEFMDREFRISPDLVNHIVSATDNVAVNKKQCSTIYKIAMKENYQL